MFSRYLFIGLGGSGGKTLRFLKRDLLKMMEDKGIDDPRIPDAWQFLNIDTPTNADGSELNHIIPQLDAHEYEGLIGAGLTLNDVQQVIDSNPVFAPELEGWRVNPQGITVGLSKGAGQFRAVGRTVAMYSAATIKNDIENRLQRLNGDVNTPLQELEFQMTGTNSGGTPPLHVFIISSLAGGSGAGLLMEVCDIIRALDDSLGEETFAVLYTPEVFESLASGSIGGVQPNALAAVSEVLNGYWYGGNPGVESSNLVPKITDSVLEFAGLSETLHKSGPAYPFLIGRVNKKGIDHGTPERLFEMVGRSIVSMMTDKSVYSDFIAHTIGNWHQSAVLRAGTHTTSDLLVNDGPLEEQGLPVFSSLGYSRLSVGTDLLKEYSTQRILKLLLEHLSQYHYMSPEANSLQQQLKNNDPDVIAKEIAKHHKPAFLRNAGLSELTAEENQVQDALDPKGGDEKQSGAEIVRDYKENVRRQIYSSFDKKTEGGSWADLITDTIRFQQDLMLEKYKLAVDSEMISWARTIHFSILNSIEHTIARCGLQASAEVCRLVSHELEKELFEELTREAQTAQQAADHFEDNVSELYGMGKIGKDNQILENCVDDALRDSVHRTEVILAESARALCKEVSKRVIKPLQRQLEEAQEIALAELSEITSYIGWNDNPPTGSVLPNTGEYTLINPSDFPKIFKRLLSDSIGTRIEDRQKKALRSAVIAGDYLHSPGNSFSEKLAESEEQIPEQLQERSNNEDLEHLFSVAVVNDGWWPSLDQVSIRPQQDIIVKVRMSLEDLRDRVHHWLDREGSAFGEYLDTGLRYYLANRDGFNPNPISESELAKRRTRFNSQFDAAIKSAAPLVDVGGAIFGTVHAGAVDGADATQLAFSEIPLGNHDLTDVIESKLKAIGKDKTGKVLVSDESIKHIDITTKLDAPMSPLVFDSLFKPIADKRTKAQTGGVNALHEFWANRRARPLRRYIPVPQSTLKAMIRGWFTCRILGLVSPPSSDLKEAAKIVHWETNKAIKFPSPLLNFKPQKPDIFSAILESVSLAFTQANLKQSTIPLAPYISLRNYGKSSGTTGPEVWSYAELHPRLNDWIDTGKLPDAIGPQPKSFTELKKQDSDSKDPVDARIQQLREYIENREIFFSSEYDKYVFRTKSEPVLLSKPPYWVGLVELIIEALEDIRIAIPDEVSSKLGDDW
ncbi:MAG: tubulin-like doman-containing protein [Actinomycetota bacterium]